MATGFSNLFGTPSSSFTCPKRYTSAFALVVEGGLRFSDPRQVRGEDLGGGEDLCVGASIEGELVPVFAGE
jgi:hypothetical protein